MRQGIYKIAAIEHSGDESVRRSHLGRLAVVNGHTQVLEDTKGGFLARSFPDGIVDDRKQRRWSSLLASPYFQVTAEGLVDADSAQDMQHPEVKPEEVFDVVDAQGSRQILEAYGDNLFLDGRRQSQADTEELQRRIHLGELHLLPRAPQ